MSNNEVDTQELRFIIKSLQRDIMNIRTEYKQNVMELYRLDSPFREGRTHNKQNFQYELEHFYELVGHCLIIGDADLLYKVVIEPIQKNKKILSAHEKLNIYVKAFQKRFDEATSNHAKFYYGILIREFKFMSGEAITHELINIE